MKKVYEIACFTSDWKNDEATALMFKLQEKMYDFFTDKKEAIEWFNGRFNFLKNNWYKKWLADFRKENPKITIGVELYECIVPNNFDPNTDSALDYGKPIKNLYFCEGE